MNEYYLHLSLAEGNAKVWEKVDQYTYDHWANAIFSNGTPRYSGQRFAVADGRVMIDADQKEMGVIMRILNVKADTATMVASGFYAIPEYIKFVKKGGKTFVYEMTTENKAA